jgi:hypothetical protein
MKESCDYCDRQAVVEVNGFAGCQDHVDDAMKQGTANAKEFFQAMRRLPHERTQDKP